MKKKNKNKAKNHYILTFLLPERQTALWSLSLWHTCLELKCHGTCQAIKDDTDPVALPTSRRPVKSQVTIGWLIIETLEYLKTVRHHVRTTTTTTTSSSSSSSHRRHQHTTNTNIAADIIVSLSLNIAFTTFQGGYIFFSSLFPLYITTRTIEF